MTGGLVSVGIGVVLILVAALVSFAVYFLPAIVAGIRGTRRQGAILLVNLVFGVTCAGWVLALVWAMCEERDR